MELTITPQTIITAAGVLSGITAIVIALAKLVRWVDNQKKQSTDIAALEAKHNKDMKELKDELQILCEGMLAALDGLMQKGANGNVTKVHEKLEIYLNSRSHK